MSNFQGFFTSEMPKQHLCCGHEKEWRDGAHRCVNEKCPKRPKPVAICESGSVVKRRKRVTHRELGTEVPLPSVGVGSSSLEVSHPMMLIAYEQMTGQRV